VPLALAAYEVAPCVEVKTIGNGAWPDVDAGQGNGSAGCVDARMAREGWMPSPRHWASLPSGAHRIQDQD